MRFDDALQLLLEDGYVLEDDCRSREGKEIRESGRKFWDEKYRTHFDNAFNSIGDWFSAMGRDSLNERFEWEWEKLKRDSFFDNEGSLKFKSGLWSDICSVIVPTLVDKVCLLTRLLSVHTLKGEIIGWIPSNPAYRVFR